MRLVDRDPRVTPLSLGTYRRMTHHQARHDTGRRLGGGAPSFGEAESAAYTDATFVGFCYGLAAGGIAWLLLSGVLVQLLAALVRAGRTLVGAP